ncbi:hypothetical protein ACHAXA_009326 [Cyclostephanos tholiformis]|uniref:AIG2-like protein n=1 Tax=Cyclostephanos tholiformis TaxID=382380 RepID=A0ABD3SR40_9STRA
MPAALRVLSRKNRNMILSSLSSAVAHAAPPRATTCFVYGTLMSPDVLRELLGRVPAMIPRAVLSNHSRHPVLGRVYPGVVPVPPPPPAAPDDAWADGMPPKTSTTTMVESVEGILLLDITPLELRRLDWFEEEGVDYTRTNVRVAVPSSRSPFIEDDDKHYENYNDDDGKSNSEYVETEAYLWSLGTSKLDLSCDWDYDAFLRRHLDDYLKTTVKPCRIAMEEEIS